MGTGPKGKGLAERRAWGCIRSRWRLRLAGRRGTGIAVENGLWTLSAIAIYMGCHDQFFTVAQAQSTRDLLVANGFPVSLTIFPNLDHNYGAIANTVNADVWTFFSQAPLP